MELVVCPAATQFQKWALPERFSLVIRSATTPNSFSADVARVKLSVLDNTNRGDKRYKGRNGASPCREQANGTEQPGQVKNDLEGKWYRPIRQVDLLGLAWLGGWLVGQGGTGLDCGPLLGELSRSVSRQWTWAWAWPCRVVLGWGGWGWER